MPIAVTEKGSSGIKERPKTKINHEQLQELKSVISKLNKSPNVTEQRLTPETPHGKETDDTKSECSLTSVDDNISFIESKKELNRNIMMKHFIKTSANSKTSRSQGNVQILDCRKSLPTRKDFCYPSCPMKDSFSNVEA